MWAVVSPTARRFACLKWTWITTVSLPLLCWFSMQPEASIVAKYKSILSKYKNALSKFRSTKTYFQSTKVYFQIKVQKHTFKVQSNFRNLGNGISETRNFLNTSDSRNPVPEPVPSKPWEQNLTRRNSPNTETFETSGKQPSEPKTLAMPRVRNPVSRKLNPEPWNSKTCRNHRNA